MTWRSFDRAFAQLAVGPARVQESAANAQVVYRMAADVPFGSRGGQSLSVLEIVSEAR
jgi:hypothetical protein